MSRQTQNRSEVLAVVEREVRFGQEVDKTDAKASSLGWYRRQRFPSPEVDVQNIVIADAGRVVFGKRHRHRAVAAMEYETEVVVKRQDTEVEKIVVTEVVAAVSKVRRHKEADHLVCILAGAQEDSQIVVEVEHHSRIAAGSACRTAVLTGP